MKEAAPIDIIRQVYEEDGYFFTIMPSPDFPNCVNLFTLGKNEEYFGKVDLSFSPSVAKSLAKALLDCAIELDNNE